MTNTIVSAAGGAMSSGSLTLINLLNAETGETNLAVLKGMTRRRAVNEYGCLSPYALRQTLKYYDTNGFRVRPRRVGGQKRCRKSNERRALARLRPHQSAHPVRITSSLARPARNGPRVPVS
jgi:hypothetical protein